MKASETELKSDASLVELGAVICQFDLPADPTKGAHRVCVISRLLTLMSGGAVRARIVF